MAPPTPCRWQHDLPQILMLSYVSPMQFEENWLAGQARQASA